MASRYEADPHYAAARPAGYPRNRPAPPVQYSQPRYGQQNYAAPPPPAGCPYSGYNRPAPPVQYSQPSYGQQNHSYAAPPQPRDPYSAAAPPAGYPYSRYNQPAPPVQYSQPSYGQQNYGQPSYGQQNYGQPVEEQENSMFGGMETGLAVGAVAGVFGGIALAGVVEYVADKIDGGYDSDGY